MNRLFLALKAQLYDYDKIKSEFSQVIEGRWMKSENLHVTVAYFANKYSADELMQTLPYCLESIDEVMLDSVEYFNKNRILYAGFKSPELEVISSSIRQKYSLEESKKFVGHVTLMRVKKIKDEHGFRDLLNTYKNKNIGIVENRFELINSHIKHPGGAQYEILKRF